MACGNQAEMIVVIGGPGRIKQYAAAKKLAERYKCGRSDGRFGFVCSRDCAVKRGWLW
jgi:hypothetical protein